MKANRVKAEVKIVSSAKSQALPRAAILAGLKLASLIKPDQK